MPRFAVILPAAGKSQRFGQGRKKVFLDLKGRPVWLRAVEHFSNRDDVVQTIVVVAADDLEWFREQFRPHFAFLNIDIVAGGAERSDSVENALKVLRDEAEYIAVHDAARPLLAKRWVTDVFAAAEKSGAAILATPVTSTVKRVDLESNLIEETVPRERLWAAQTPQVFRRDVLVNSFRNRGNWQPTDEAQLVERQGHPVAVVPGSMLNLKITNQEDLGIAEALLDLVPAERGLRPLHPFADEEPRWPG